MSWRQRADAFIAQIDAELPADADLKARRAALRAKATWFHGGTSWGKKVWAACTRSYLAKHGLPPKKRNPKDPQGNMLLGPDIIFPFRENQP